jgi:hypothetical protein
MTSPAPQTREEAMHLWGDLLAHCGRRVDVATGAWRRLGWGEPPIAAAAESESLERSIQWEIVKALRSRGCIVWHADAGSKADPGNRRAKAGRPPVGWPDLQVYAPGGRHHLLEVKRPGEKPRPDQVERHEELAAIGFTVHVVTSVAQALEVLGL